MGCYGNYHQGFHEWFEKNKHRFKAFRDDETYFKALTEFCNSTQPLSLTNRYISIEEEAALKAIEEARAKAK